MPPNVSLQNTGGLLSPNQIAMSYTQRALYDRLRQLGITDAVARQLAVAVAKSESPAMALAKSAMQAVHVTKKSYHAAFVEQARKDLHPTQFEAIHRTARAVSGGVASGMARRAQATEETPEVYQVEADDDVIEAKVKKAEGVTPPQGVQSACKRGLEIMSEYGGPGLTEGAKSRARSMAAGNAVSPENIRRMKSFFARHDSYAKESSPPSPGYVAWMLWGGDAGKSWATSQAEKLEKGQKPLGAAFSHARAKTKNKKKQKEIANRYLRNQGHAPIGKSEDFDESKHPRAENGQFSDGGGQIIAGRTSASVGLKSAYVSSGDTARTENAHQHLADAHDSISKGESAANAGRFAEAAEHFSAAKQSVFHANALAKGSSNQSTGKSNKASKEALAKQKSHDELAKRHQAASAVASRGQDEAKSYLHYLAAGAHASYGGAVKTVSQAKLPSLSLVKAMAAMTIVKSIGPLPQEFVKPDEKLPRQKKKKENDKVDVTLKTKIIKAEQTPWHNLVYSTVYAPDELDTDGDYMDPATIEKAAHDAMAAGIYINHEHQGDPVGAHVVESYIAPCDMQLEMADGQSHAVAKGSWMMALKVTDPEIWRGVLDGSYGGFSLEGSALAETTPQAA